MYERDFCPDEMQDSITYSIKSALSCKPSSMYKMLSISVGLSNLPKYVSARNLICWKSSLSEKASTSLGEYFFLLGTIIPDAVGTAIGADSPAADAKTSVFVSSLLFKSLTMYLFVESASSLIPLMEPSSSSDSESKFSLDQNFKARTTSLSSILKVSAIVGI